MTIHHFEIALSDVDRGTYERLDLRVAQHPSETMRYLVTRVLAYALSYGEGIAFSKGGLSSTDEPPLAITDRAGILRAWIDVGAPSAERLHKASKAAERVAIFTSEELSRLRREAATKAIHRVEAIEVWRIDPAFLESLVGLVTKGGRKAKLDVTRNEGQLYIVIGGTTLETTLAPAKLTPP